MDHGEPLQVSAPLPADFMEALVTMSNVSSEQWQLLMRKKKNSPQWLRRKKDACAMSFWALRLESDQAVNVEAPLYYMSCAAQVPHGKTLCLSRALSLARRGLGQCPRPAKAALQPKACDS